VNKPAASMPLDFLRSVFASELSKLVGLICAASHLIGFWR
jgi:hypothetical protein